MVAPLTGPCIPAIRPLLMPLFVSETLEFLQGCGRVHLQTPPVSCQEGKGRKGRAKQHKPGVTFPTSSAVAIHLQTFVHAPRVVRAAEGALCMPRRVCITRGVCMLPHTNRIRNPRIFLCFFFFGCHQRCPGGSWGTITCRAGPNAAHPPAPAAAQPPPDPQTYATGKEQCVSVGACLALLFGAPSRVHLCVWRTALFCFARGERGMLPKHTRARARRSGRKGRMGR